MLNPHPAVPLGPGLPETADPAAANAAAASFAGLTARLDYLSPSDLEQVRQAYRFADEAHLGQLRNSGEPYITHPIAVAAQCAEWKLDAQALMAALLHDAIEDCGVGRVPLDAPLPYDERVHGRRIGFAERHDGDHGQAKDEEVLRPEYFAK